MFPLPATMVLMLAAPNPSPWLISSAINTPNSVPKVPSCCYPSISPLGFGPLRARHGSRYYYYSVVSHGSRCRSGAGASACTEAHTAELLGVGGPGLQIRYASKVGASCGVGGRSRRIKTRAAMQIGTGGAAQEANQLSSVLQELREKTQMEEVAAMREAMNGGASAKGPVVVTGASGYIGSWLVMKLLQAGYTVRATVRDPANVAKTEPLLDLPGATEHLSLWKADLAVGGSFDDAIRGCTGVFHVATPMDFESKDPENEMIKPTVEGMISIMRACKEAGTVRRIVFTSSAGTCNVEERRRPVYDEENWTDVDFCRRVRMTGWMYFVSKTLAEKAALAYAAEHGLHLICIIPTLVVGPFFSTGMPPSLITALALVTRNEPHYSILKQVQFVHIDDLCDAHLFLFEHPGAAGRYICSSHDATIHGLAAMLRERYPEYDVPERFPGIEDDLRPVHFSSKKLLDHGFTFRCATIEDMYDAAIRTCREKGLIPLATATAGGDACSVSVRATGETDVTIGA